MNQIMDSDNKVCRVCLGCCPQEYYNLNHGSPSFQVKLQECIPFMDFKIVLDPIICVTCAAMLDRSYQLLIVARNVENRLGRYMKECCCNKACYIMAYKPEADLLRCLEYHTVVDDPYNFSMVVAVAAKSEFLDDLQAARPIKVEDIDLDYDENEGMPNLELMPILQQNLNLDNERSLSPLLIPFLPIEARSPPSCDETSILSNDPLEPLSSVNDNNGIEFQTVILPPTILNTECIANQQQEGIFLANSTPAIDSSNKSRPIGQSDVPYKILVNKPEKPIITNQDKQSLCANKIEELNQILNCHQVVNKLMTSWKLVADSPAYMDTLNNVNTYRSLAATQTSHIKCIQCGNDYNKSNGHKCLFSSYIRLERDQALETMANTFQRLQNFESGRSLQHCGKSLFCPNGNSSYSKNDDGDIVTIDDDPFITEAIAGDTSTLSGISVYKEDCDNEMTDAVAHVHRCLICQLRFDNTVQLNRHTNLKHPAGKTYENLRGTSVAANINRIVDEHSYAWFKSIQCWNCTLSFEKREDWILHDYKHHKTTFLICYICFRGFKHSQIIFHMTNTHSLVMAETNFFHLLNNHKNPVKTNLTVPNIVDETYSRMCRFIMFDYKLTHCPLCQRPCGNTSLLMRHLVMNGCTKSTCLLCTDNFDSSLHLLDHLMTYQHRRQVICANDKVNEKYACQICESVFLLETAFVKHSCFDDNNPFVVYRRKMGLWTCAECLILSPDGITAKQIHILSVSHLKRRLNGLIQSINTNDLSCHICVTQPKVYKSKSELVTHLKQNHIERLSVLCPLCCYMALNPESFSHHLSSVHLNALHAQNNLLNQNINNFSCLLCDRKHCTINSFWKTCGRGHNGSTFTLEKVLKYIDKSQDVKRFHSNNSFYNCECGRMIETNNLYTHYSGLKHCKKFLSYCSYWAGCELCGALISPSNKLGEHKKREHRDLPQENDKQLQKIRCKDPNELLEIKNIECIVNTANVSKPDVSNEVFPLLGKRKRRKTQLFLEVEESGGFLAMDKKIQNEIEEYSKKRPRYKSQSPEYVGIHVNDVEKINAPSMQPFVQLVTLDPSLIPAKFCETKIPSCQKEVVKSPETHLSNLKTTFKTVKNLEVHLHMIEAIDRVVDNTGISKHDIFANVKDRDHNDDDDDDDDRSSCSSEMTDQTHQISCYNENKIIQNENELQLPHPFIEPKEEKINIKTDSFNINNSNENANSADLSDEFLEAREIDKDVDELEVEESEVWDNEICISSDSDDSSVIFQSSGGCISKNNERVTNKVNPYEQLVMDKTILAAGELGKSLLQVLPAKKSVNSIESTEAAVNSITASTDSPRKDAVKIMYNCDKCHLLTASTNELNAHSCLNKINVFRCWHCHKDFSNDAKLNAHMVHEHNSPRMPIINSISSTLVVDGQSTELVQLVDTELQQHRTVQSLIDGLVVSVMASNGKMPQVQQKISQQVQVPKMFRCSLCREIFQDMDPLIVHMKTNHFNTTCIHCDDKLANKEYLNRHLEICVQALRNRELNRLIFQPNSNEYNKDSVQNDCSNPHSTKNVEVDVSSNATSAINYNIFRCLDCDLLLAGFFVAKEHFSSFHQNAAGHLFSCHVCDAFSIDLQLIKQHKQLHKDGSFKCIVCSGTFNNFMEYKDHYGEHKMASCPYCPHMFLDLEEFRTHINVCSLKNGKLSDLKTKNNK